MTACPRCAGPLAYQGQGLLRCAEHGVFLPGSAFRGTASYQVSAALRAAISGGQPGALRCASCAASMRPIHVPLPEEAHAETAGESRGPSRTSTFVEIHGCAACNGWWFDAPDLERLRATMLSRPTKPTRAVGGYSGLSRARTDTARPLAEGLFALLRKAGAFVA